jgi:malonyl-CoA decarboxylase
MTGEWADASMQERLESLCRQLLSSRGEASGVAIARQVLDLYAHASSAARDDFFHMLARNFGPDWGQIVTAFAACQDSASPAPLRALIRAVEPPRQELFRRLNYAPGGTAALLAMREDLLSRKASGELRSIDDDFVHLFGSWFNRGFLHLRRFDWSTPADILERIIRYEAVHEIQSWDDLRARLQPPDRRCFAFFHPSLAREPLIFVQVALTDGIPDKIQGLLVTDRTILPSEQTTTAVFYSISNCQLGLRGVSFGNFLIKQVVEELTRDVPSLTTFVTLSPAPGYGAWLARVMDDPSQAGLGALDTRPLRTFLSTPSWHRDAAAVDSLRDMMLRLAAAYYLQAKTKSGEPLDPVARFHLGNGARLERLNWPADTSPKGLREAAGLMVNYLYDHSAIEANHEAFVNDGAIAASAAVRRHLPGVTF